MEEDKLNDLKYRQLQKLAKEHGVKANLPKAEMIKALLEAAASKNDDAVMEEQVPDQVDEAVSEEEASKTLSPEIAQDASANETEVEEKSPVKALTKQPSRRNSRISRLFDKEAFDVEAAKVSRFAEKMGVNSPRRRSSILNLTPVKKGESASAIGSPLVVGSPFVAKFLNEKVSSSEVQASLRKLVAANSKSSSSPSVSTSFAKTPLHKRSSMNAQPRTSNGKTVTKVDEKKKKTVTMKAQLVGTPGSITKAKASTGIPRPRKVPDFAKLHAKQFRKMDTLNQYLDKKKERIAALTPGPKSRVQSTIASAKKVVSAVTGTRKSPRNMPVTEVSKANFNFSSGNSSQNSQKKPFVFKANSISSPATNKVLHNITNSSPDKKTSYKPYTGKLKPWNPKETLKERQQMANKTLGNKTVKEKQMTFIKGVRLNKRTELMLQKRRMEN